MKPVKIAFISIVGALCITPLVTFTIFGSKEKEMNSESVVVREKLTAETWFNSKFQASFEEWWSTHFPGRTGLVSAYNSLHYQIESSSVLAAIVDFLSGNLFSNNVDRTKEYPEYYFAEDNIFAEMNKVVAQQNLSIQPSFHGNNGIIVGKSGYLYSKEYVDEYYGYSPSNAVDVAGINKTIDEIKYIQTELKKMGTEVIFVISPNKAAEMAEFVPEYYKNANTPLENYKRHVEYLKEGFVTNGVNFIDSSQVFKDVGLLNIFPKTGIHWNYVAASEVVSFLLKKYEVISNTESRQLTVKWVNQSKNPYNIGNAEQDIYDILYGSIPEHKKDSIVDDYYYTPVLETTKKDKPKLKVLMQGDSFLNPFRDCLADHEIADLTYMYYYGGSLFEQHPEQDVWKNGPGAWESLLQNRDLLILEANEQLIRSKHYEGSNWLESRDQDKYCHNSVYDSLYAYLKGKEGK
ncbi:MAG: hypothetical protein KBS97_00525 [Firmicutes bacterium]|nr:hypothetical protein [Candidatus Fiminaster equi]